MVVVIMVMIMVMMMVMKMMMVVIKRAGGVFFPQVETFPPDIWWKETQEKYTDPGTYILFAFSRTENQDQEEGTGVM